MMEKRTGIVRHVLAGLMLVALGGFAGNLAFSSQAVAQSGCGLQQCWWGGAGYSCQFTYEAWYCDNEGPGCLTKECEDPEGCEGPPGECIE